VYGHFIPGANRAAVNRLTKAVADAKPRPDATQPQPEATIKNEVIAEVIDKNGAPGVLRLRDTTLFGNNSAHCRLLI
jgi:hypothetical protein